MAAGMRDRKGLTIIDAVLTLCLIGVLFLVVVPRYQRLAQEARETALKAELANIRT
jgi:Tfp pilus assembly protein PilE